MTYYILLFMLLFFIIKGIRAIIHKADTRTPILAYFGLSAQLFGLVTILLCGFGLYLLSRMATFNIKDTLITIVLTLSISWIYWNFTPIKNFRSHKDINRHSKNRYRRSLFSKEWITSGDWIEILVGVVIIALVLSMFAQ